MIFCPWTSEAYIFKVTELFESTVVLFNDPVSGMMMFKHFGEDIGNGRGVIFRDFVFKISSKDSHHSIALEMNFTSFMGNINLRNLFLIVCLLGHYPIFFRANIQSIFCSLRNLRFSMLPYHASPVTIHGRRPHKSTSAIISRKSSFLLFSPSYTRKFTGSLFLHYRNKKRDDPYPIDGFCVLPEYCWRTRSLYRSSENVLSITVSSTLIWQPILSI